MLYSLFFDGMKYKILSFFLMCHSIFVFGNEEKEAILVNFPNVSMHELIKFGSRVAGVNFIGDPRLLEFDVSFLSGKPLPPDQILSVLIQMLEEHDLDVKRQNNCLFITKKLSFTEVKPLEVTPLPEKVDGKFQVVKLQYHQGSEILEALKQISSGDNEITSSIASMQWIRSTNSLFFSGNPSAIHKICSLIESLDTQLKQVLIEVLVIETSLRNSLDFGLEWSFNSKYKDQLSVDANLSALPLLKGFDLGIIGDLIFHKGKSFVSLSSLISALQMEGDASIVLNQKLLAQENKSSRIFVGDNIPFAGAVVQTIGNSQQTTANVEYRDVGVTLNITPLLGDGDIITLEISEEITEALDHLIHKSNQLSGIKTSKTNMATSAHVPDGHFLILSGMTKTMKTSNTSGPPCLGGVPMLSQLLNKKEKNDEKSNLLIFVKPHIIRSANEYAAITSNMTEALDKSLLESSSN